MIFLIYDVALQRLESMYVSYYVHNDVHLQ